MQPDQAEQGGEGAGSAIQRLEILRDTVRDGDIQFASSHPTRVPEFYAKALDLAIAALAKEPQPVNDAFTPAITPGSRWRHKNGRHLVEIVDMEDGGYLVTDIHPGAPLKRPHKHLTEAALRADYEPAPSPETRG